MNDCQPLLPEILYNFHVPIPWIIFKKSKINRISIIILHLEKFQNLIYLELRYNLFLVLMSNYRQDYTEVNVHQH